MKLFPATPAKTVAAFFCMNRELAKTADGTKRWSHLAPFCEERTPTIEDGHRDYEVVTYDKPAFEEVARRLALARASKEFRGLDLGRDHQRHQAAGTTERYGKIFDAKVVEDTANPDASGLWIEHDLNPAGVPLVRDGLYSFLTGEFDLMKCSDGKTRPYMLTAADLTNNPNLRVQALNRDTTSATASPAGGKPNTPAKAATKGNSEMNKYKLMCIDCLKLNATATDEEIDAAFAKKFGPDEEEKIEAAAGETADAETEKKTKKAMNRVIVLQADTIKTLRDEQLGKEADLFIEANKASIKALNRADVRAAYIKDAAGTKKLFGAIETKPVVTALNREDTQTPADRDAKNNSTASTLKAELRAKLVDDVMQKYRCQNRTDAVQIAQGQRPDLW